jgi:serine/threonine protein phosphatase 1
MKYVIADIHGGSGTFTALLDRINLRHSDQLYLLGDYVDRGPDNRGVLNTIIRLKQSGYDIRALRGNHDDALLRTVRNDHDMFSTHYRVEWGWHTMQSFGIEEPEEMPTKYTNFLESLPYLLVENEYIFVHAGLDMGKSDPLLESDPIYMLWDKSRSVDRSKLGDRTLVTGHVIDSIDAIKDSLNTDNIRLDNGAFTNKHPDWGNLVALNLDTKELTTQPWCDSSAIQ